MRHMPRTNLSRANECESCYYMQRGELLLQVSLHPDSVLNQHHYGVFANNRREHLLQQVIVCSFQTHYNHIRLGHLLRVAICLDIIQMERTVARIYLKSVLLYIVIIAMKQETHLSSCLHQAAAIISSNCPSTNN